MTDNTAGDNLPTLPPGMQWHRTDDTLGVWIPPRTEGIETRLCGGKPVTSSPYLQDTQSSAGRSLQLPLLKAAGVRKGNPWRPVVLDATAGLGEDSWLLAATGCQVFCMERNPVVHRLLQDGLARSFEKNQEIFNRIHLLPCGGLLSGQTMPPQHRADVILLDPMFPSHEKRKTAERKQLSFLRLIAGSDPDSDDLLAAAKALSPDRIVVKRPSRAGCLNGCKPNLVFEGKGHHFDTYLTPKKDLSCPSQA